MDSLDIQLSLRHARSRAKWWKDLRRTDPPPFLGPLVTVREAMQSLSRSESYVRNRIDDGRLNTWKDPVTRRVWILKEDVDLLKADLAAIEERRPSRPRRKKDNPQSETADPQSKIENRKSKIKNRKCSPVTIPRSAY